MADTAIWVWYVRPSHFLGHCIMRMGNLAALSSQSVRSTLCKNRYSTHFYEAGWPQSRTGRKINPPMQDIEGRSLSWWTSALTTLPQRLQWDWCCGNSLLPFLLQHDIVLRSQPLDFFFNCRGKWLPGSMILKLKTSEVASHPCGRPVLGAVFAMTDDLSILWRTDV